jgi:hypothetical protein
MTFPLEGVSAETFAQANPYIAGMSAGSQLISQLAAQPYAGQLAQGQAAYAQGQGQIEQYLGNNAATQLPGMPGQLAALYALQQSHPEMFSNPPPANTTGAPPAQATPQIPGNPPAQGNPFQASVGNVPSNTTAGLPTLPGALQAPAQGAPTSQMALSPPQIQSLIGADGKINMQAATGLMSAGIALPLQKTMADINLATTRAQLAQAQIGNVGANQFFGALKTADGQAVIANNPAVANQVQNKLQGYMTGQPQPTDLVPTQGGFVSVPNPNYVQQQAQNNLAQKNYTPTQQSQIIYTNSVDNMLKDNAPIIQSVASYSGINGLAKLKMDELNSARGQPTSPDYVNYTNFVSKQMPIIGNEIRRAFGGQATDSENQMINGLMSVDTWNKSPQVQLQNFQSLVKTLNDNRAAITQSRAQNLSQAQNSKPVNIPGAQSSQFTPQNFVSQYKNANDLRTSFKSLPPDQQTAVAQYLKSLKGQ